MEHQTETLTIQVPLRSVPFHESSALPDRGFEVAMHIYCFFQGFDNVSRAQGFQRDLKYKTVNNTSELTTRVKRVQFEPNKNSFSHYLSRSK